MRIPIATGLACLGLAAGPAPAAEFLVDDAADAGDALPGDGECASLAGGCTLRAAVQEANALAGPDRITLPARAFTLSVPGPLEDAALAGDLDLLDDVSIEGAGAGATVIDANGLDRIFHLPLPNVSAEISDLTLRNGLAEAGGGILNVGALSLDRVVIRESTGVSLAGAINNLGSLTATHSSFVGNRTEGNGGAIANDGGSMLLMDCEVSENFAGADAGGLGGPGAHTLVRTRIANNFAGALGGGIASPPGGALVLIESRVEGNEGQQGGGIGTGGSADIESSTIAGNVARSGSGGIGALGELRVSNSTISGNRATGNGGGVGNSAIVSEFQSVTIVDNVTETGNGGGLGNTVPSGPVRNTILAGNRDLGGEAPDCSGTLTSDGFNLIQDPTGCAIGGDATGNLVGVDPRLGPLADNGGPTPTHLPEPGSPAIDAGGELCPPTDQRGALRPEDGDGDGVPACDIGAVEVGAVAPERRVAGGGWLRTHDGRKILFGLFARPSDGGFRGGLLLYDQGARVGIHLHAVEAMGGVEEPCGSVRAGAKALQIVGAGRFDGESGAHFRICVEDRDDPGHDDEPRDLLFVECVSGCAYATASRTPDDEIDAGNLEVRAAK